MDGPRNRRLDLDASVGDASLGAWLKTGRLGRGLRHTR